MSRKRNYSESQKKLLYDFEVWLETVKKYAYIWLEDDVSLLYDSMSAYTLLMKSKGHSSLVTLIYFNRVFLYSVDTTAFPWIHCT